MSIPAVGSGGSASLSINANEASGTTTQSAAQKFAESRAEARAGISDGDEPVNLGNKINTHA